MVQFTNLINKQVAKGAGFFFFWNFFFLIHSISSSQKILINMHFKNPQELPLHFLIKGDMKCSYWTAVFEKK